MRKTISTVGVALMAAIVQFSPALATLIGPLPEPDGVMGNGQLDIFITNQTSSTITVNWLAGNNGSCATNTFVYYNVNWDEPGNHDPRDRVSIRERQQPLSPRTDRLDLCLEFHQRVQR